MTEAAAATTDMVRKGDPMLAVDEIAVYYGNIAAVKGLSLRVHPGEIVTLIGSNGAGKSTTLRRLWPLKPHRPSLQGAKISGRGGTDRQAGICQSPEGRHLPAHDGLEPRPRCVPAQRQGGIEHRARVLAVPPRRPHPQKAGTMSGGGSRCSPWVPSWAVPALVLDEPSWVWPSPVDLIFDTIETIREQGTTVLVVEQNALAALRIADYAYVLESGVLKLEGPAAPMAPPAPVLFSTTMDAFIASPSFSAT
jgi:branched-chain amino acid transport system ATP-binding protein